MEMSIKPMPKGMTGFKKGIEDAIQNGSLFVAILQ